MNQLLDIINQFQINKKDRSFKKLKNFEKSIVQGVEVDPESQPL